MFVVGYPFLPIGMGEHARSTYRALVAAGVEARLVDVADRTATPDPDLEAGFREAVTDLPAGATALYCVNGDVASHVVKALGPRAAGGFRIIYPAWELARYPRAWVPAIEIFDEVWAPSQFIREAIAGVTDRPVIHMPLAVELKMSGFLGRRWFGIPEDAFTALFFFDFDSYAERKNPGAVLDAFERLAARRPEADLHCVIKTRGARRDDPAFRDLDARVEALGSRAQLISGDLGDNEIKNLVRNCDVFVSLHRAEGFGRGMAEAMALGRVAVATGYSGNLDFMAPDISRRVDYQLIPVRPGTYPQGDGQVWADASPTHACDLLEALMDDPAGTRALGRRARANIRENFSLAATGGRYRARIETIRRSDGSSAT